MGCLTNGVKDIKIEYSTITHIVLTTSKTFSTKNSDKMANIRYLINLAAIDADRIEFEDAEVEDVQEDVVEVVVEEVDVEDDEGIVGDVEDDLEELAASSKYVLTTTVQNEDTLFCTTASLVVITDENGESHHLCHDCYGVYLLRAAPSQHFHNDLHSTTKKADISRVYCNSCNSPLHQIRLLDICITCNNINKKQYT